MLFQNGIKSRTRSFQKITRSTHSIDRVIYTGQEVRAGKPGAALVLLQAQGLSWADALGVARLAEVSITLHAGEIVGVAGVSGNGQSELLDVLVFTPVCRPKK